MYSLLDKDLNKKETREMARLLAGLMEKIGDLELCKDQRALFSEVASELRSK